MSTSFSKFFSFSLVNVAFTCYLCVLDAWLNASSVKLLASVIDYSSMTLHIASQIFALDNEEIVAVN